MICLCIGSTAFHNQAWSEPICILAYHIIVTYANINCSQVLEEINEKLGDLARGRYIEWLEQPLRSSLNRVTNQHLRMSYSTRRSHGGFNKGSPIQKPVEVGKQYEVDVTEISRKGDGIAKIQGFVIFVENGKVGNKIKVEINEVADRFAKATIVV